jgi:hypothetical protein
MKFGMIVPAPKYWYVPCIYHLFISYILCKKIADFQSLQIYISFNCILFNGCSFMFNLLIDAS